MFPGRTFLQGQDAVDFVAVAAAGLSEKQCLSGEVGGLDRRLASEGMAGVGEQKNLFRAQRH